MVAARTPRVGAKDVEEAFPEAVAFARAMREVFGEDVRLSYARNSQGQQIGKPLTARNAAIAPVLARHRTTS